MQLLALKEGGRHPEVRGPGTLAVLEQLGRLGLLSEEETAWLRSGWRLLSAVRNTLYLIGERDNSVVPTDPRRQARLAAAMHEQQRRCAFVTPVHIVQTQALGEIGV